MALFLDTQSISREVLQIIKDAKRKLILVSPYFQTSELFRERIRTKSERSTLTELTIIYGKESLRPSEIEWMEEIKNLIVLDKKNLHAKCYLNESRAVICSMNLYEYSQQNNIEMGILITKKEDPEAFRSLMDEIESIKHNSTSVIDNRVPTFERLTLNQKLMHKLINQLVQYKLKDESLEVLTDVEIISLACQERLNIHNVSRILPEEKFNEYVQGILKKATYARKFTIGKIEKIIPGSDEYYPKIHFLLQDGSKLFLDCTEKNLPRENAFVAVKINDSWFNEHIYLEE